MSKIKHKIGDYEPYVQEKGVHEAFIHGIKNGEVFWTVQIDSTSRFDTKSQAEAIIISKLSKIEQMLKDKGGVKEHVHNILMMRESKSDLLKQLKNNKCLNINGLKFMERYEKWRKENE